MNLEKDGIMNTNTTKRRVATLAITIVTLISIAVPAFASNDNIPYEFDLKAGYVNSYSEGRYRQTTDPGNYWKVNMTYNSEGSGTIATYWLARTGDKTAVSFAHDVKQGTGPHLYEAEASSYKTTVSLAAENNNNSACRVAGYWDEEIN